ncbi:hypothetical protein ZHAS_00012131 [Anopheles sinensis]|uniref:Uncharacterized protein n=1 Tax=Anopheles sinensis TaxID=74873 RepID=A0A084W1Z3_ANOSI|nr:hypothetical protein ZHAS_00012131 [Anopheles sinensis]
MNPIVILLFALLAVSCRATTTDREDVAGSKEAALATFLQPLEVRLRDDRILPDRNARELGYLGTGYNYSPYTTGHYNPYNPVYGGQHAQYNPYSPYVGGLSGYGSGVGGFGGVGAAGAGGFIGGGLTGGLGGYPAGGQLGYGIGQSAYPYANGWNALQSPVGYGNQLAGYYNRGLYV